MSAYVPRIGDRIKVEMTVVPTGKQDTQNAALADWLVAQLAAAGKVELISRAEPDWQPGDIGQHIETGERYIYDPARLYDGRPWLRLARNSGTHGYRRFGDELAGKLVRCTVTPEGDA